MGLSGRCAAACLAMLASSMAASQTLAPAVPEGLTCAEVPAFLATDAGLEYAVNPGVSDFSEIETAVTEFRMLRDCAGEASIASDRIRAARAHLDLFVSFLEPYAGLGPGQSLELVDLRTTSDPAVERLRSDVGLEAPDGRIFVRYFSDPGPMPEPVRRAFDNPQARAVTIGTRYVAILAPAARSPVQGTMLDAALSATLSHELVHAFLNARLGAGIVDGGFPSWFHEGVAIHFSGSGRGHVAIDHGAGSVFRIEPSLQYERYERAFRFMEQELGTGAFRRAVRDAVESADASVLLARAGGDTYEAIEAEAERWWRWRPIPAAWLAAPRLWVFLFVVGALGAASWRAWRRWQPAVPGSALEVGVNADLFEAVKSADDAAVKYLLRSGAEAGAVDGEGWSPLRWAVFLNRTRAVEALLGAGAPPSRELLVFADLRDTDPEILRLLADRLEPVDD